MRYTALMTLFASACMAATYRIDVNGVIEGVTGTLSPQIGDSYLLTLQTTMETYDGGLLIIESLYPSGDPHEIVVRDYSMEHVSFGPIMPDTAFRFRGVLDNNKVQSFSVGGSWYPNAFGLNWYQTDGLFYATQFNPAGQEISINGRVTSVSMHAIPEPPTFTLAGMALAAVVLLRRGRPVSRFRELFESNATSVDKATTLQLSDALSIRNRLFTSNDWSH